MCDISAKKRTKLYQRIYGCDISSMQLKPHAFFLLCFVIYLMLRWFYFIFFSIWFSNELICRRGGINEYSCLLPRTNSQRILQTGFTHVYNIPFGNVAWTGYYFGFIIVVVFLCNRWLLIRAWENELYIFSMRFCLWNFWKLFN